MKFEIEIRSTTELSEAERKHIDGWLWQVFGNPDGEDYEWANPDWHVLVRVKVDLMASQRARVAAGRLPRTAYDRIWTVVTSGRGTLQGGRQVELEVIVEPIALVPPLEAGRTAEIEVALVVLPVLAVRPGKQAGGSGDRYTVFTNDARWQPWTQSP